MNDGHEMFSRRGWDIAVQKFLDHNHALDEILTDMRTHLEASTRAQMEMKLREAIVVGGGVEGRNVDERDANLKVLLAKDKIHQGFKEQYEQHHRLVLALTDAAEIERNALKFIVRLLDFEIVMLRLLEESR